MGLDIGKLLYGARIKYKVSAKDVCRGICSVSSYCMYENGEVIPDILLVNMFLERLGFGILGLTAYVTEKEVSYFKWKERTRECVRNENYIELRKLLEQMPTRDIPLNKKIREQYAWFLKGIVAEKDASDLKSAKECYENALKCSCAFLIEGENIEGALSVTEIHIYAIYLQLLWKINPNKKKQIIDRVFQLMQCVNRHYVEEQQRVKIYPLLVCLWGNLIIEEKNTHCTFDRFDETFQLLQKQKSLYCLLEIMRLRILFGEKEKRNMESEQEELQILRKFFQEDYFQNRFSMYEPQAEEIMTVFVGHYLTAERKKVHFTQEKISEGICSVESYSRIENGRKPSWKNYRALTEKIGVENRYYMELINTGKIDAVLLRREISQLLFTEINIDKVKRSLEELKKILGEDECVQNKQYLKYVEICMEKRCRNIPQAVWCEKFREILAYSMKENVIGQKIHIYTKVEINIINQISVCLARMGKRNEAMRLIEAFLSDIDETKGNKYHETKLARLNYGRWLSDSGEYGKAEKVFMEQARQIVERDRAELLDEYIGEIAYNKYLMNNSQKSEEIQKYSQYALVLSKLFGSAKNYRNISEFYEKIQFQ